MSENPFKNLCGSDKYTRKLSRNGYTIDPWPNMSRTLTIPRSVLTRVFIQKEPIEKLLRQKNGPTTSTLGMIFHAYQQHGNLADNIIRSHLYSLSEFVAHNKKIFEETTISTMSVSRNQNKAHKSSMNRYTVGGGQS